MCADMRGDPVELKNSGSDGFGTDWHFIVDTCDALSSFTGYTDCKPDAEVRAIMNSFLVTTKVATQFFSAKTYIDNDYRTDTEFQVDHFALSRSLAMFNHFTVERVTTAFSNRMFYNDQLLRALGSGADTIVTYSAKPD